MSKGHPKCRYYRRCPYRDVRWQMTDAELFEQRSLYHHNITRCKDCKHYRTWYIDCDVCEKIPVTDFHESAEVEPDFFCAYGERDS